VRFIEELGFATLPNPKGVNAGIGVLFLFELKDELRLDGVF
jgi:hypothetical protein